MTSPICQVKEGAGAYGSTLNGVDVTAGSTVTIKLYDTTGVRQWSLSLIGTDESCTSFIDSSMNNLVLPQATIVTNTSVGFNAAGSFYIKELGTTVAYTSCAGGVFSGCTGGSGTLKTGYTVQAVQLTIDPVLKTATFTAPAEGTALIFQSKVNNGRDINNVLQSSYTTTFGIFVKTADGFRVGAVGETTEGNSSFGWVTKYNDFVRHVIPVPPGASPWSRIGPVIAPLIVTDTIAIPITAPFTFGSPVPASGLIRIESNAAAITMKDGAGVDRAILGSSGMSGFAIGDASADIDYYGNPIRLQGDVEFHSSAITVDGNPTWDFGAGLAIFSERVLISDPINYIAGLEMSDGYLMDVAPANAGRIRYNELTQKLEQSVNTGAWAALGSGGGGGWAGDTDLVYVTGLAAPKLYQANLTTLGGTGETLLIHAQDETGGGASVGGALDIRPGSGVTNGTLSLKDGSGNAQLSVTTGLATVVNALAFGATPSAAGVIRLTDAGNATWLNSGNTYALFSAQGAIAYIGGPFPTRPTNIYLDPATSSVFATSGSVRASVGATSLTLSVAGLLYASTVPSPSIQQLDDTSAGVSGDTFTIKAQNVTGGGSSIGGNLYLHAGYALTNGLLALQDGYGNNKLTITAAGAVNMAGSSVTATGNPTWNMGTGLVTLGGDLSFENTAHHTISVAIVGSGTGKNISLIGGDAAGGSGTGGSAYVVGGIGAGLSNGGDVYINAGDGFVHGFVRIGDANTQMIRLGNATDNTPITQVGTGLITLLGVLAHGASPASAGSVRLTDTDNITWLNVGSGNNYALCSGQGTDSYLGGAYPTRPVNVIADGGTNVALKIGGVTQMLIASGAVTFPSNPTINLGSGTLSFGNLSVGGAYYQSSVLKAFADTGYTVASGVGIVRWNTVGGACSMNLPAVSGQSGRTIEVLDWTGNCGTNNLTIYAQGGETVNGLASIKITTAYGGCVLYCDGVIWRTKKATI